MKFMKRLALALVLVAVAGALFFPVFAEPKGEYLTLSVAKMERTDTSNPGEVMLSFTVNVTNKSSEPVQFTNNNFGLMDSTGMKHLVNRARFFAMLMVEPGKTVTADRIFFNIPKEAKPKELVLFLKRKAVGRVSL
jgi:hypothetical protein